MCTDISSVQKTALEGRAPPVLGFERICDAAPEDFSQRCYYPPRVEQSQRLRHNCLISKYILAVSTVKEKRPELTAPGTWASASP